MNMLLFDSLLSLFLFFPSIYVAYYDALNFDSVKLTFYFS